MKSREARNFLSFGTLERISECPEWVLEYKLLFQPRIFMGHLWPTPKIFMGHWAILGASGPRFGPKKTLWYTTPLPDLDGNWLRFFFAPLVHRRLTENGCGALENGWCTARGALRHGEERTNFYSVSKRHSGSSEIGSTFLKPKKFHASRDLTAFTLFYLKNTYKFCICNFWISWYVTKCVAWPPGAPGVFWVKTRATVTGL